LHIHVDVNVKPDKVLTCCDFVTLYKLTSQRQRNILPLYYSKMRRMTFTRQF